MTVRQVRFQADAYLNQIILLAMIRREPAVDFQTASEANLAGVSDKDVLAKAAKEGRLLVTHDQTTMPHHFAEFILAEISPGLIVIPQHLPIGTAVDDLLLVWSAAEADEWINRICYLPL